jgi:hypothetical protein
LPLPGGGYRVPTSAFPFHAGVAWVGAKAVVEFLLFEILRLFRAEFGRDKRGLGARRITGSISADAAARTAAPAMSAMSVMFFIYGCNFWFLHAYNSRLAGPCIWDQSPTPRRIGVEKLAGGERRHDGSPSPKRSFPREKIGLPRNKRPIPTLNSCRS